MLILLVLFQHQCQCKSWECQCDWSKQSHNKIDNTALGSLEMVEINEKHGGISQGGVRQAVV